MNPIDQALAGSILGVVVRLKHGPKAWLSGAAVGGGLGAMAGSYMWVRTYLSGITIEERWSQEFKSIQRQQEEKRKEVEEIQEKVILNKKKWTAQDLEPSVPSSTESALLKIKSLLPGGGKKD